MRVRDAGARTGRRRTHAGLIGKTPSRAARAEKGTLEVKTDVVFRDNGHARYLSLFSLQQVIVHAALHSAARPLRTRTLDQSTGPVRSVHSCAANGLRKLTTHKSMLGMEPMRDIVLSELLAAPSIFDKIYPDFISSSMASTKSSIF